MSDDNVSVRDEFTEMVNARIAMLREVIAIQDKNLEQRDLYITELRSQLSAAEQDARRIREHTTNARKYLFANGRFHTDIYHSLDAIDAALPATPTPEKPE